MKDFCKLKELRLRPPKILSECPDPNLKEKGGLAELNNLAPIKNKGGLEELNRLVHIKTIGGLKELNDCLCDNIEHPYDQIVGRYTHSLSDSKIRAGTFQPPALVSSESKVPSKPAKIKGGKQGNNNNKPLPMAELSKVISQRMPFVSYKKLLYYCKGGIFKPCLQADFLELLWEILSKDELAKYNLLNFRNAYTFITSSPDIKIDYFPMYEYCAVCNDYMVNLLSGEIKEISPNDYVTSRINANFITSGNIYTPMFDHFLLSVSNGDEQLERLICEVIGWCCTLPNHSQKVFFVLGYAPDSGKSVIGSFLQRLYGDDFVSYITIDEMGTRFGLSSIVGKAINISMDLPGSALNSAAVSAIKMITGGDGVSIDIKYMPSLQYKRPILRGRDIKRYSFEFANLYIIATFPSKQYNIEDYPAIKNHFLSYGIKRMEQTGNKYVVNGELISARKKTNNKWFETQDSINYWDDFSRQKIVWGNLCLSAQYTLVKDEYYINAPAPFIVGADSYLLGMLNSKVIDWYVRSLGVSSNGGYFEYKPMFVEKAPIPHITKDAHNKIANIANKIMKMKQSKLNTQLLENELDNTVYDIFGLTDDEIYFLSNDVIASISSSVNE